MLIHNDIAFNSIYKCNKKIGNYIIKNFNIPVLSMHDKYYVFSNTEELRLALKKIPFILKLFYGEGGEKI